MWHTQMEKQTQNRKGQAGLEALLTGFTIVAAVLFLIVLIVFIFSIVTTSLENTKDPFTVTNDTSAKISGTGYQLAAGITGNPRDFSVSQARNGTSGLPISAPNYTITTNGTLVNVTAVQWPVVHLDYSYNNDSVEITASKSAQDNTDRAIPLVGLLFIIIAVGAIITVLVVSLLGRRRA